RLDRELARAAIARGVGAPLGLDAERAAWSILAVANERMGSAIRDITVKEGLDPRASVIGAGGGAGGMTIAALAGQLGCDRVVVPRTAGALSACGGQFSDIVTEFSISRRSDTDGFDFDAVNAGLAQLDGQMEEFFDRVGEAAGERRKEFI